MRVRTASPSRAHRDPPPPPPPPTSGSARFLPLPGLGFRGLSSSQLTGSCDPAATCRSFAVPVLWLHSRPRRCRLPLLPLTRLQLLATPRPEPAAPAPGASPTPGPPLRPAPRYTPISVRDTAPSARASPSASASLRAGYQGVQALHSVLPTLPRPSSRCPRLRPLHRDAPGRLDGARPPLRSALTLRAWGWLACGASPRPEAGSSNGDGGGG